MIKFEEIELLAGDLRDIACPRRLHEEAVPKQAGDEICRRSIREKI